MSDVSERPEEKEKRIINEAGVSIIKLRKFFKVNGVGEEVGSELLNTFLNFTFTGGAEIGENSQSTSKSWSDNPVVKEWVCGIQDIISEVILFNEPLIDDLFSEEKNESPHYDMLKSGFLDALLGREKKGEAPTDGTAGVIACLATLKITKVNLNEHKSPVLH